MSLAGQRVRNGFTLIEVMGALIIFSFGVLALLSLTGVVSLQLNRAGKSSTVTAAVQDRLDSLRGVPYDTLLPGSSVDTIQVLGEPYLLIQMVLQAGPLVREAQVTLKPADGRGPELTASTFVSRSW